MANKDINKEKGVNSKNADKNKPKVGNLEINSTQLFIVVNGAFLTLLVFLFFHFMTSSISRNEFQYISEQTSRNFLSGAKSLDFALFGAANMVSKSEKEDYPNSLAKAIQSIPEMNRFNAVVFVAWDDERQRWAHMAAYTYGARTRGKAGKADVTVNQDLINIINSEYSKKAQLDTSSYLFQVPKEYRDENTETQMLIQKVKKDEFGKNVYLFGITEVSLVFPEYWDLNSQMLGRITITSDGNDNQGWSVNTINLDGTKQPFFADSYDFGVWQSRLKFYVEIFNDNRFKSLKRLPYIFLFFGLVTTIITMLYVRDNQMKSERFKHMNMRLGKRNKQLKSQVSEREKLYKALRQSERENRAIIDAVSDIIFETNTKGEILFLSASWRKVTGMDAEQFIGQEIFAMLHPQDQKSQKEDFMLLVKGQKQAYRAFTRLRTSDGTFRAVEIAFSMIRQDKNRNLRVVGSFTDVEERRRAERALSEAEKKYRAIVENAAGGIYQLTPEGIYLSANPAMSRILGFESPEQILREVKNANMMLYVHPKERMDIIRQLHNEKELTNIEAQMITKDGEKIWVNENIRVVRDDTGNILYFEGSIADVTKRKESEIALREAKIHSDLANRAKSEFLANMSHELRTPLNSIIGFSEIIKNEVFGKLEPDSYWEYAKDINESGQSLLRVINEILDISKIEAGERQLNEAVVDVRSVLHSCLDLIGSKIEKNQMQLIKSLDNVPKVIGEELAIKQIFMNLISNAVKFTPSGGRLTLSYDVSTKGELSVSVTDTGIGLDDAEIQKALSPFGQADSSDLSRNNSGTGLGLTLVDALIKLHDGRFELFSEKGIGTTATVIFPVDRVTVQTQEKPKEQEDTTNLDALLSADLGDSSDFQS